MGFLLIGTGTLPASAQQFTPVDLDGHAPDEQIYAADDFVHVLMWDQDQEQWIDVLRGPGTPDMVKVAKPREDDLADIRFGDRDWGWRGSLYVPLPFSRRIPRGADPPCLPKLIP